MYNVPTWIGVLRVGVYGGGSVAGWMLLVLLINEVDEVYVGKADKKSERCCIISTIAIRSYFRLIHFRLFDRTFRSHLKL